MRKLIITTKDDASFNLLCDLLADTDFTFQIATNRAEEMAPSQVAPTYHRIRKKSGHAINLGERAIDKLFSYLKANGSISLHTAKQLMQSHHLTAANAGQRLSDLIHVGLVVQKGDVFTLTPEGEKKENAHDLKTRTRLQRR